MGLRGAFRDMVEWERACGRPLPAEGPRVPEADRVTLCHQLIGEEVVGELLPAILRGDLTEIADAAIDSIYTILDCLFEHGIDPVPLWEAIHRANMAKHGPGAWRDEAGKIRKPATWVHPDIAAILAAQWALAETYGEGRGPGA